MRLWNLGVLAGALGLVTVLATAADVPPLDDSCRAKTIYVTLQSPAMTVATHKTGTATSTIPVHATSESTSTVTVYAPTSTKTIKLHQVASSILQANPGIPTATAVAVPNTVVTLYQIAQSTSLAAQAGFSNDATANNSQDPIDPAPNHQDPVPDVIITMTVVPLPLSPEQTRTRSTPSSESLPSTFEQPTASYTGTKSGGWNRTSAALDPTRTAPTYAFGTSLSAQTTSTMSLPLFTNSKTTSLEPSVILPTSIEQPTNQNLSTITTILSIQTSTTVSSSASATSTACGQRGSGDFTITFDEIPGLGVGDENPDTVQPQPATSPYHQFDWSNGFTVVPPPTDPYLPSSGKQLTEFIPNFNVNLSTPDTGPSSKAGGFSGDIAVADHGSTGCFSFDFYGASLGCDSRGPDCRFNITGYSSQGETKVAEQHLSISACPALVNCTLERASLDEPFRELTEIHIQLTVAGQPKIWWMDDLRMSWSDVSCEAATCRANTHIPHGIGKLRSRQPGLFHARQRRQPRI
ncbi:uncharacterized protein BP5553_08266 [Venustampulla echinocandica]|uniref:DUF7371 domain-containing protein n=1 Tax=Venustampulla echinocandica TaxID=2656787 RepID=A0A370TG69_9HELO|nr:uncharacterized protein BP5553_08266 [Venustampulla echinocandica]RDL33898.1 hypothetical protein BP5553_08266 [Venustampulla echinocandica]